MYMPSKSFNCFWANRHTLQMTKCMLWGGICDLSLPRSRYIAAEFPREKANVTIFMGVVEKLTGFAFIAVTSTLIELDYFVA